MIDDFICGVFLVVFFVGWIVIMIFEIVIVVCESVVWWLGWWNIL